MRIGFTERGDAGRDFSWHEKLANYDGGIIITKKMSDRFIELMLSASKPVILHCGCTGWGGTWLEPNVPDYKTQLGFLKKLIDEGFPTSRIVLRIDPIIPTPEGLNRVRQVLDYVIAQKLPIERFRMSVLDEYPHVRERLAAIRKEPFYGGRFYAPAQMMTAVKDLINSYPFIFETCAEDQFTDPHTPIELRHFISRGCCSPEDITRMGLTLPDGLGENNQNRNGCHCLSIKSEMLTRKTQCPNGCLYCYWKS